MFLKKLVFENKFQNTYLQLIHYITLLLIRYIGLHVIQVSIQIIPQEHVIIMRCIKKIHVIPSSANNSFFIKRHILSSLLLVINHLSAAHVGDKIRVYCFY